MLKYDILIIGGGPGGYVAAIRAAQLGAKVALIEKHKLGGVCLHYGCIPSKSYLKSAKIFNILKNSENFGISKNNNISFDWGSILQRKNKIVKQLAEGIKFLLRKNKIDVYNCFAEVLTPFLVKVGDKKIETKKIIVATGSNTFIPNIPGVQESFNNKFLYTSKELLQLDKFPKKLIIIGGGFIGVEFATIFNKFGAQIVILEKQKNILNNMDHDIINELTKKLKNDGVKINIDSEVVKIENNKVYYKIMDKIYEETADIILMSIGNKPNLEGIQKLNLKTTPQGIITDDFLRTSVEGVYAIGDVNGKYMLAHVASHEGIIAVSHALNCKKNLLPINYNCIPSCVYCFPEIASVGLTEQQAKEQKLDYKISIFNVKNIGKALADGEINGFAKLIIDKNNFQILGMHIIAENATELISEISVTMTLKGTAYDIAHTIHPHPTLSEIILESVLGAIDKPLHI